MIKRYAVLLLLGTIFLQNVGAQNIYQKYNIYRNPIYVFLNKFSITATTGYATTKYKHDLKGVYFFQDATRQFIVSNQGEGVGSTIGGFSDWLNDPTRDMEVSLEKPFDVPFDYLANPVNNLLLGTSQFLLNTDTAALGFESNAWGIPILLSIHFDYEKFRIGIGFMYEKQYVKKFMPTAFAEDIRAYQPGFKSTNYTRLFGIAGYQFYQFWNYDFVAELQIGKTKAGKQFNKSVIDRGIYANLGVSIENNWSEYFRVVVRSSIDFKSYAIRLPDGVRVNHGHPTFFIQAGISINIPDIPRSPMKSDHIQLKHVYTDPATGRLMEVRGQPIWKNQNPKVGKNYRTLWRYRKKTRGN